MEPRWNVVERYDWVVWVVLSVIVVLFGVGDIQSGGSTFASGESVMFEGITGTSWDKLREADPSAARFIDAQVKSGGAQLLFIGLLTLAISVLGLRKGQRWAWLTMWLWPIYLVLVVVMILLTPRVPGAGVPVPLMSGLVFLVITVGLLLLTFRKDNPTTPGSPLEPSKSGGSGQEGL